MNPPSSLSSFSAHRYTAASVRRSAPVRVPPVPETKEQNQWKQTRTRNTRTQKPSHRERQEGEPEEAEEDESEGWEEQIEREMRLRARKSLPPPPAPHTVLSHASHSLVQEISKLTDHPSMHRLNKSVEKIPFLSVIADHTHVPPLYLLLMVLLAVSLLTFQWIGFYALLHCICFVYPAYLSYHALEHHQQTSPDLSPGHIQTPSDVSVTPHYWLQYWCISALWRLVETVLLPVDFSVMSSAGSTYSLFKLLFFFWCAHPVTHGCVYVHRYVISPLFVQNSSSLNWLMDVGQSTAVQFGQECSAAIKYGLVTWIAGHPPKQR